MAPAATIATGEDGGGHGLVPPLPEQDAAEPGEPGDPGRQRHHVVRVDDPGHEAERQPGDGNPGAPDDHRGPYRVGARRAAAQPEQPRSEQQHRGQQPGDLAAELAVEEPEQPGRAPAVAAAHTPGFIAVQPAQAVVAQGQLQDGVVLRAADVRAVRRGNEFDGGQPPPGRDGHRRARAEQVKDAPACRCRRREQVGHGEAGDNQQDLQLLGEEPEAQEHPGEQQPAHARVLDGAQHGVGGRGHQKHQQGVGVVEPEHQHGHRCQRHDRAGEEPRAVGQARHRPWRGPRPGGRPDRPARPCRPP